MQIYSLYSGRAAPHCLDSKQHIVSEFLPYQAACLLEIFRGLSFPLECTQEQVGEWRGIVRSLICSFGKGNRQPDFAMALLLTEALGAGLENWQTPLRKAEPTHKMAPTNPL